MDALWKWGWCLGCIPIATALRSAGYVRRGRIHRTRAFVPRQAFLPEPVASFRNVIEKSAFFRADCEEGVRPTPGLVALCTKGACDNGAGGTHSAHSIGCNAWRIAIPNHQGEACLEVAAAYPAVHRSNLIVSHTSTPMTITAKIRYSTKSNEDGRSNPFLL